MSDAVAQKMKAYSDANQDEPRPCFYCGAPWFVMSLDPDHKLDCPSVTGVYPVLLREVEPHGFCCPRCNVDFKVGDFYKRVQEDDSDDVCSVVCLPCLND